MTNTFKMFLSVLLIGICGISAYAKDSNADSIPAPDPEIERQGFKTADGFQIQHPCR